MPYAEPTSPIPSPLKKHGRRLSSHDSNASSSNMTFRSASTPMPGIPRRSSSTSTPAVPSSTTPAPMRSVETLPRRTPLSPSRPVGGLGLQIYSSPSPQLSREGAGSDSSDAPITPQDRVVPLPPMHLKSQTHSTHAPPRPSLGHRSKSNRERAISTSAVSSPSSPPSHPSFTHMVRKKSGELVKPSLKQRSMSTPDLGRNGTADDLRVRNKSVRFDDLGLESVVLFLREQKPTAVSKAAETDTPTETEEDNDTDLSDFVHFRTRRNSGSRTDGKEVLLNPECTVPRLRVDFGPGTQDALKNEHVVLERVEMQNGSPLAMRGTVLVRNVSFQKWVAIRFTLDHWQTVSEVACQHVSHVPPGTTGDEGWDRFSFNIRLEDYKRKIEERILLLCVRFSIDGEEWWDSNMGANYRFSFKRANIRKPRSGPTLLRSGPSQSSILPPLRVPRSGDTKPPRSFTFPRVIAPVQRSDSPQLSPPPAAAFQPPETPDVHSHLQLKRYCAPSPPKSPPKKIIPAGMILTLAPVRATGSTSPMVMVNGRPASAWSPHERSHSWSGKPGESWQDSEKVSMSDNDDSLSGDTTPRAARARSPETRPPITTNLDRFTGNQITDSPISATPTTSEDETAVLPKRRSTGGLSSLLNITSNLGLVTPPSSDLSSPPTPTASLPGHLSASLSTGDTSPVNTLVAGSPDESSSQDQRGRMLNAASYQEFLDKFCFFKSPTSTPVSEHAYTQPDMSSGYSSPNIYGYFGGVSVPDRGATPTPRGHEQQLQERSSSASSSPLITPPATTPSHGPLPWTPSDSGAPSLTAA